MRRVNIFETITLAFWGQVSARIYPGLWFNQRFWTRAWINKIGNPSCIPWIIEQTNRCHFLFHSRKNNRSRIFETWRTQTYPPPTPPASIQSSPLRDAKMGKNKSRARSSEIYLLLVRKNFNSPKNRNSKIKIAQVCQKRYAQMTTIYIDR